MLFSNFCIFNLTYTNIYSNYKHNNTDYNDEIISEYTSGSEILNNIPSEIGNINNIGNNSKIDAVTISIINIDDKKLPLKKRKISNNFLHFNKDTSVKTKNLILNASVTLKQINDDDDIINTQELSKAYKHET